MPSAAETAIEQNIADNISEAQVGTEKVTAQPIPDLIAADKHLGAKEQARSAFPLRMNKISPPGAA